jgi:formate dehydrogenase
MSQPFWPLYLDRARLEAAENLKLVITAGVGSDHIDLAACRELGVDVVEITQSNSSSVAEHAVMQALGLVRNYIPSNREVHRVWGQALPDPASARLQPSSVAPGWDIAACASRSYDVMGLNVGTVGCGRIARGILDRLSPFDVANFMYTERARLPPVKEHQLGLGKGAHYFEEVADMLPHCDLVFINCPLTAQTDGLFSADLIAKMKRGAYLVNTARGRVCDQDAVVEALRSGQLGGYAGDVWFPQPAPADHPWRDPSLPTAMTPHISGTSLDAQHRYASGVAEVLWEFYKGEKDWLECYNVVRAGKPAGVGAASYTEEALDPVAQK